MLDLPTISNVSKLVEYLPIAFVVFSKVSKHSDIIKCFKLFNLVIA